MDPIDVLDSSCDTTRGWLQLNVMLLLLHIFHHHHFVPSHYLEELSSESLYHPLHSTTIFIPSFSPCTVASLHAKRCVSDEPID